MNLIPLSKPDITDLEIEEVVAVLRSSRLSLGPRMEEFEHRLAAFVGVPHALAVSSGTAGLHLCLLALRLGPGDEIIVPSFTFIAAANVIRYVGATPIFVDIDASTRNLDPALIEAAITPRTRAILVVHTFGVPAEMSAILAIATRHNLLVVEDACEAIGAEFRGQRVGSFGDAAVFAFYPNKQITTGEGGMVVTRNADLAREIKALRNQGRYGSDEWHQHSILGYNYRLSEINCALGCAQMHRLESILASRQQAARTYHALLSDSPGLVLPPVSLPDRTISWFVYVVRLTATFSQHHRDALVRHLGHQGIQCGRYFAPVHTQPAYSEHIPRHPLPITEAESMRTIALPFFTTITVAEIQRVADCLLRQIAATSP